jgi:hypothetical protein
MGIYEAVRNDLFTLQVYLKGAIQQVCTIFVFFYLITLWVYLKGAMQQVYTMFVSMICLLYECT